MPCHVTRAYRFVMFIVFCSPDELQRMQPTQKDLDIRVNDNPPADAASLQQYILYINI